MNMKSLFFIFALFFAANLWPAVSEELFEDRAKCVVYIKYAINFEEEKRMCHINGTLVNDDGLIVVSAGDIPMIQLDMLSDFKVYVKGGDINGYPADYLGAESFSNAHFLKLRKPFPEGLKPLSKFPRADFKVSDKVWGIKIMCEDNEAYYPIYLENYISFAEKRYDGKISSVDCAPMKFGNTQDSVTALGAPVFNSDGAVVGFGWGETHLGYSLFSPKGDRIQVILKDDGYSAQIMSIEDLNDILANIPKTPEGDKHGWAGFIGLKPIERGVAEFVGLPPDKCAFVVSEVIEGSPVQKAGIKSGDIILGCDGENFPRFRSSSALMDFFSRKMERSNPGDKFKFRVARGGEAPKELDVSMVARPKILREAEHSYFKRLGFSIREFLLDDAINRRIFDGKTDGAVVQYVKDNSPASSALPNRLVPGYILREINGVPVKNYAEAVDTLKKFNDDTSMKELVILAEDFSQTKVVRIKLD